MPVWKLIHIVVRWAMLVVAEQEGRDSLKMPVLSQLQLGRFMSRSDARTCLDLAMDVLRQTPGRDTFSDEQIFRAMMSIRQQAAAPEFRRAGGYSRRTDSLVVARQVLDAVERQVRAAHDRQMFWSCCRTTTWAAATLLLPGRDWQSVRDDFRKFALLLYQAESVVLAAATDRMCDAAGEMRRRA